jgi:hypothetical protein
LSVLPPEPVLGLEDRLKLVELALDAGQDFCDPLPISPSIAAR